jgi:hypothetical protein
MRYENLRWFKLAGLLLIALMAVVGCAAKTDNVPDDGLPLADGQPTLLFFYTDN